MTNRIESTQRPTRRSIAWSAAVFGAAVGFLIWLIGTYPEDPHWYDRLGVGIWSLLVGLDLLALVGKVRRRWSMAREDVPVNCRSCEGCGYQADGMCWDCQGTGKTIHTL